MLRMISGALEPSAMSVKFARVGFQIKVFFTTFVPSACSAIMVLYCEVMTSIESINTSEMIEMPMNK